MTRRYPKIPEFLALLLLIPSCPAAKIAIGSDFEAMTPERPGEVNKPPTDEFRFPEEEMLGDRPMSDDGFKTISVAPLDADGPYDGAEAAPKKSASGADAAVKARMKFDQSQGSRIEYDSDRDQRLREIQNLIPVMTGRGNATIEAVDTSNSSNIDISHLPPIEKIVSFFPKCNAPKVAKDSWREENLLYLYFNVSYNTNATLASAIIRLHRLPRDGNQTIHEGDDEEKLLRVSIYWYSKLGKKQKSRKRLCDSKVVGENQNAIELNVRPAVTSWIESQNLGFAVKVENQEEVTLRASSYFKGDDCKSTNPQSPASSLSEDLTGEASNEIGQRILENYLLGSGIAPQISVCTVESLTGAPLPEKLVNCQLQKTLYSQAESESRRKVQGLIGSSHHLRHQKHLEENPSKLESHLKRQHLDIRNLMENKTVYMSKDELDRLNGGVTR